MTPEITPARWQRLQALYESATELAPEERAAFIARETIGDPELARHVIGMLAQSVDAGARIAGIVEEAAGRIAPQGAWIGRRFGPYRVVREIGRGGMGLVFEAVRDDAEYQMRVALKAAPWWQDTPAVRERFRHERQILAELEHPNIARFLDGGTDDGVPYFVMEYVEGQPITLFCEERGLNLRQRLALFQLVCEAVHFAHGHLVVHRDLKPANILVGDDGQPKLLDFGIAKLIDPVADPTSTTGEAIWTPDYTSPEQVRGRGVTTRTDVYSLGLILYELLTGERGQIADQSSPLALDRSICETTPAPPSERARNSGHHDRARRLRGDLDTIVMMAIRKEPEGRYGSLAAFADDVGRYLKGRPVQARASTVGYRLGKFLRRNKAGTAATALLVVSVAAGTVATLYQARRAERRFEQVRTLANAFVFDVHDRIATLPGATEARKSIVQTALTYLENLQAEAGGDASLARELAAAYEKIATVQGDPLSANLGDTAGAIASYNSAQRLLDPLAARGDRAAMQQLASVTAHRATVHQAQGDMKTSLAGFESALTLAQRLAEVDPNNLEALSLVAETAAVVSRTAATMRDLEVAQRAAHQAVDAAQRLATRDPSTKHRDTMATAHNALGGARLFAGHMPEAAESFKASVAIREQLVADLPGDASLRRNLLVSYGNLGDVLGYRPESLGDRKGALAAFERAVALAEDAMKSDSADQRAPFDAASAHLRVGSVLAGDPATLTPAVDELRTAERLVAKLLAPDPTSERYRYLAFNIDLQIGTALARGHQVSEASVVLNRVRAAAPKFMSGLYQPGARSGLITATIELAKIHAQAGDRRAIALAEAVAKELTGPPVGRPIVDAATHGELGRVYLELAKRMPRTAADLAGTALVSLEKSAVLWKAATLPVEIESRRAAALAALDVDIAAARRLLTVPMMRTVPEVPKS